MPQQENPPCGNYEISKTFGSDLKDKKMSIGGKYKWKPDSNPPPGIYNPDMA